MGRPAPPEPWRGADGLASSVLDADDDQAAADQVPALPMPAAARVSRPGGSEEADLMEWNHRQCRANVGCAEIAKDACRKGCWTSEDVLRSRYKGWREKHAQADAVAPPT